MDIKICIIRYRQILTIIDFYHRALLDIRQPDIHHHIRQLQVLYYHRQLPIIIVQAV
jgi:hypothetical protein